MVHSTLDSSILKNGNGCCVSGSQYIGLGCSKEWKWWVNGSLYILFVKDLMGVCMNCSQYIGLISGTARMIEWFIVYWT